MSVREPAHLRETMGLILHGGNARGRAMVALRLAREGDLDGAQSALSEAKREILDAHHIQKDLLADEAAGQELELSLLLVHGQDHLMTAMAVTDLAAEMVELHRRIAAVESDSAADAAGEAS